MDSTVQPLYNLGQVFSDNLVLTVKAHKFVDEEYKKVWLSLNHKPV